jgi:HTH-type transcriptional regulator/antitoxin HigA
MMITEIFTVENDDDLAAAQDLLSSLMLSESPNDVARLRAQALLVQAYEEQRWPSGDVSPVDILSYVMDQHGLSAADMRDVLGHGAAARVSEILAGKKGFSLPQIRRMHERYGVPAELLLGASVTA